MQKRLIVIDILLALILVLMARCDATPLPIPPEMDPEMLTLINDPGNPDNVLFDGPVGTADPSRRFTIQDIASFQEPVEISLNADGSFTFSMQGALADSFRVRIFHRNNWVHFFDCHSDGMDGVALLPDQDADGDTYPVVRDCNDTDPSISPGAPEICGDRLDNDCDGLVDEADCAP